MRSSLVPPSHTIADSAAQMIPLEQSALSSVRMTSRVNVVETAALDVTEGLIMLA